jgi:hypothetical protein
MAYEGLNWATAIKTKLNNGGIIPKIIFSSTSYIFKQQRYEV